MRLVSKVIVFISWSGEKSKKLANIFREWLPTVIQSIEPFVSSEDIEKGSRWNTDIAQELNETKFGIICVTKDNLNSPWINFEAGALSKSLENTYVAPVLFDVKPSELKSSPISQFQATSFTKEDMKRLIETLNNATDNGLAQSRLNKAFDLCYSDLETSIDELRKCEDTFDNKETEQSLTETNIDSNLMEEILEMVRNTQRLIGNSDSKLYGNIDEVNKKIDDLMNHIEKQRNIDMPRTIRRFSPMVIERLMMSSNEFNIFPYNIMMILSVFKDDMPWLYDAGSEIVKVIKSNMSKEDKHLAVNQFSDLLYYTMEVVLSNTMMRDRKDYMILKELPLIIHDQLEMIK